MGITRDQFLTAAARRLGRHTLPDGTALTIRELMSGEKFAAAEAGDLDENRQWRNASMLHATVVRYGACDDDGMPLFTDDDLPRLAQANETFLVSTSNAIWALSEVRDSDLKSDGAAPDAAGNERADGGAEAA